MSEINEKALDLALRPELGAPFALGGKDFTLQYLTYDAEQRLLDVVNPAIKALLVGSEGVPSNDQVFAALRGVLPEAVAVILADQDSSVTVEWVRGIKEPRVSYRLYEVVSAQQVVSDLGKLLSDHLLNSALMQQSKSIGQ